MDTRSPDPAPFDWGLAMGLGIGLFATRRFTHAIDLQGIRAFTRQTLAAWDLSACADDVTAVASELVCGALDPDPHDPPASGWLGLAVATGSLLCTVTEPVPHGDRPDADHRRRIICELSIDCGPSASDPAGPISWARLPVCPPAGLSARQRAVPAAVRDFDSGPRLPALPGEPGGQRAACGPQG